MVGGKTGTAQLGTDPPQSHAWIIGFAGPPGETPHVAVAVIVEAQPGASEQTGGQVAAPIAARGDAAGAHASRRERRTQGRTTSRTGTRATAGDAGAA